MGNKVVEIKNLYKKYKDAVILNKVNLELEEGKIYGIVGRNGSGKSMLFKTICGLINPTEGEVKVFGEDIANGNFPKNTGVIIEAPGFLPQYSGFNNLKLLASINNVATDEDIKKVIDLVGLNPEDKKPVKKFSLGMKQRLGIAQAIMEKPKLLILDEPMNGLDSSGVEDIRNLIKEYKSTGVTIILSSHNKEDIEILCDEVFNMENGVLTSAKTEKSKN
ncbi:ABC transporter ATP-binding protein [Clostridium sp. C8-1-8]|uniref:ABC transporter ATP-binding protein n=1 Tax=Clostridium sp. C8-1-8 TaxID=2698831 RepID=UPI001368B584|nr:ABC transporter ATP-binding protein [Clostridium sp. C8-1-8]